MVQDPLGIRQLDAVFLEAPPDAHEQFTFGNAEPVLRIVDPDPQLEVDGTGPEARQEAGGLGVAPELQRLWKRHPQAVAAGARGS